MDENHILCRLERALCGNEIDSGVRIISPLRLYDTFICLCLEFVFMYLPLLSSLFFLFISFALCIFFPPRFFSDGSLPVLFRMTKFNPDNQVSLNRSTCQSSTIPANDFLAYKTHLFKCSRPISTYGTARALTGGKPENYP